MKAIVLAGGGGIRLWPLSRDAFPKQFLKIGSGLSLLQTTVDRLSKASFIQEIVIATNTQHLSLVREQLDDLVIEKNVQILVEPTRKNTAPAIALAVKYLQTFLQTGSTDPILVLPSDHLIEPQSVFFDALEQMGEICRKKGIITFGIRPTRPETGYGYIQVGKKRTSSAFSVEKFVEKPNLETAQHYLTDPHFYWNSGIFLFTIETFWKELKLHAPAIYQWTTASYEALVEHFKQMPDVSIDYAIMEKTKEVLVCPLPVQWSDIGSWDSVYDVLPKDKNKNVKLGQIYDIETKNCLLIGTKRLISTIGVDDLLVVETEDALFISKKGLSQKVKSLVETLVQRGRQETTSHSDQNYAWGSIKLLAKQEHYSVEKICLKPREKIECIADHIIALRGQITVEEQIVKNSSNQTVEFLTIKTLSSENQLLASLLQTQVQV